MFTRDETMLVAVSGGKDSLALWDVLIDEGYQTDRALSRPRDLRLLEVESKAKCEAFAASRGVPLLIGGWPTRWARRCRSSSR